MENNTKAFNRINSFTNPYFEGEKELVKRVNFVSTVIMNTLRKFPTELWPEELAWAKYGSRARITGFDFRDRNDNVVEITEDKPLTHDHTLSFYIIGKKNWTSSELTVRSATIPASLLFNDPMAIAQYARNLIRNKQSQIRTAAAQDITKKVDEVEKKLANLAAEKAKLEQQRTAIRQSNQQAREAINKNRAKQEKRRAAKLLKANS
jgi:hypothetical protein